MPRLLDSEIVGTRLVNAAGENDLIASVVQVDDVFWVIEIEGEDPCLAELERDRGSADASRLGGGPRRTRA